VTVAAELRGRGALSAADVVVSCEAAVPVPLSVWFYGRRVLAASVQRQVAAAGRELVRLGEMRPGGTVAALAQATRTLDRLAPVASRVRLSATATSTTAAPAATRVLAGRALVEPARR
jgi:hypothetical protein